jgi:DNA-binding NarL/FixJ family response regulator
MRPIYLLDDHAMMRDGLRAVLLAGGHTVAGESGDPTQALDDLKRIGAALLLLDLHLGQRSGFELLTELQRRKLDVRTIVLSMSAQPRHVAEALRLGALGYVLKGAAASELLQAIAAVDPGQRRTRPAALKRCRRGNARSCCWWYRGSPAQISARCCIFRPRRLIPTAAGSWPSWARRTCPRWCASPFAPV